MSKRKQKWKLITASCLLAAVAGAAALTLMVKQNPGAFASAGIGGQSSGAGDAGQSTGAAGFASNGGSGGAAGGTAGDSSTNGKYIVVFKEPALAAYQGDIAGMPKPQRRINAQGKLRLDVRSAPAANYRAYLQLRQSQHGRDMSRRVGRNLAVSLQLQHAINGVVTTLSQDEAEDIRAMPDVMLVEEYREYEQETETGPLLIGAGPVWDGTNPGASAAYQGEGVVFGILDSGVNFGSPSFAATSPADSYLHVNPLGDGVYLGTCAAGGVDAGRCNAKLIGGYDFVCTAPGNQCGVVNIREEPGFGDTNGHGSHTASTAAGNRRDVDFRGTTRRISGVAPRGNVIAYDVCYTNTATGQGLCPNVSSVAAVNQAVADGVVDVINFSIGGGAQPWSDAVSLAFLGATNAGIYVSASAGNSGPGPNTLGHLEPWVSSTAAAQHGRGGFSILMQATGPAPIPEALTAILLNEGVGGVAHTEAIAASTPLKASPTYDTAADGCVAFAAGAFQDAIALIQRGGCAFTLKANNAAAAGAVAVVIGNNVAGVIAPSVPGTTVRVFGALQSDGIALKTFANANPTATALIGYPASPVPNVADALAAFSSRGPAGSFSLIKPDITGPGVSVLAVTAGDTLSGFEGSIGLLSGTSMSSPHQAGSAGLVRQARPGWTVPEIKSALMMTAKTEVFLEDEVTLADPFARGSGRLQVDRAINAGLVMHETADKYLAANPAADGDPSTLNLASLGNRSCFGRCTFTRSFRSTLKHDQIWMPELQGLQGSVRPRTIRTRAGETVTVQITVDSYAFKPDGAWHFGTLALKPMNRPHHGEIPGGYPGGQPTERELPTLRLPVAVAVQPPSIALPQQAVATAPAGGRGIGKTRIGNVGGSTLGYSVDNTGTAVLPVSASVRGQIASGFRSTTYTDPNLNPVAQYTADDFVVSTPTQITQLFAEGFLLSTVPLASAASDLTWSIYPDAGGVPAGNPLTQPSAAVWSYTAPPTAAGVSTAANNIALDLVAASQPLLLPPGRYWLVVNARATFANRWVWYGTAQGNGAFATLGIAADGSGAWAAESSLSGLSMKVTGAVPCGAPWMTAFRPPFGRVEPGTEKSTDVVIDARSLVAGSYSAYYCVSSDDPLKPKVGAQLLLNVAAP